MKVNHLSLDKSNTPTSLSPSLNNTLLFLLLSYPASCPRLRAFKDSSRADAGLESPPSRDLLCPSSIGIEHLGSKVATTLICSSPPCLSKCHTNKFTLVRKLVDLITFDDEYRFELS